MKLARGFYGASVALNSVDDVQSANNVDRRRWAARSVPDGREPRPELGERGAAAAAVEVRRGFAAGPNSTRPTPLHIRAASRNRSSRRWSRDADAHGQAEDFSRGRFDAAQMRAAAGDDDFAEHLIARKMFEDVRFREPEHFEHARQDDRAQLRRGDLARAAPVERLDVKRLLGFVRTREPEPYVRLTFSASADVVLSRGRCRYSGCSRRRDRRAVDHAAVGKNRDVGRAAADVEQDAADVLFFRKQRCRRRCQGLEHDPGRFQTARCTHLSTLAMNVAPPVMMCVSTSSRLPDIQADRLRHPGRRSYNAAATHG